MFRWKYQAFPLLGLALLSQVFMIPVAWALQPLDEFLRAGATQSFDSREAIAVAAQRNQELLAAYAKLAPTASATVTYTRNQNQVEVDLPQLGPTGVPTGSPIMAVLTAVDQTDAVFSLGVPLVDAGAWQRIGVARDIAEAARARQSAAVLDNQKQVARAYFQYVAAYALVAAGERARDAASENEQTLLRRRQLGLSSELDLARASADTERARQSIADAELTRDLAARSLETLTGLLPSGTVPALGVELREEAPLPAWESASARLPQVRAAVAEARAARKLARAAWMTYVPSVSGMVSERLTNAGGFGQSATWTAYLSLGWRADLASLYSARAMQAAGDASAVQSARTRRDAEDQIYNAWSRTRAYLARSRAARAQAESAQLAASLSHKRYAAGSATQLEVIQAERDAFAAEVSRIQADADLAYSRVLLRLNSGQFSGEPGSGTAHPAPTPTGTP